jgi:hypothetical protein
MSMIEDGHKALPDSRRRRLPDLDLFLVLAKLRPAFFVLVSPLLDLQCAFWYTEYSTE